MSSTEKLTKQTPLTYDLSILRHFFTASCKPKPRWRMGVEYEISGVHRETRLPLPFRGDTSIEQVTGWFRQLYGEDQGVWEEGYCYGVELPYGRLTLEPGGQIEFSSHPAASLQESRQQLRQFLTDLCQIEKQHPILFYASGVDAFSSLDERPWSAKGRYKIMREYLGKRGKYAHHMMKQTMSIQFNIDFADEQDAVDKYMVAHAMYPTFQFLSSNSRIYAGELRATPFRPEIWDNMDPDRSGLPPKIESFNDYIEYALDVPMFFLQRNDELLPMEQRLTFREFLQSGYKGHTAVYGDWEKHLSTLFPEVRFKKNALELRMFDGNEPSLVLALTAVVLGIYYNEESLLRAKQIEWKEDWTSVQQLVKLAENGLSEAEAKSLQPIRDAITAKQTPGQRAVAFFEDNQKDPQTLLRYLHLCPNSIKD